MDWINYTLFTLGGAPVLLIDLVSSILGLTCVFLAGRNSKYNFWVGYLYTAALFLLFWNKNLYASLFLQPISLTINIIGHWRWTHPKQGEASSKGDLKVTALTAPQRILSVVAVVLLSFAWGWLLNTVLPIDPHPYLDTVVTVLILYAQLLSALKKWDCWIVWLMVNITQIILHVSVGHVFMPIVCALYLVNGIWSLASWRKLYKKENK